MAKKKNNMLYGAGEQPNTPNLNGDGFPISFGKGNWAEGILESINEKTDDKVRFVFNVNNTNSGAIYVGNTLASSKILNIEKDDTQTGKSVLRVTYIATDGTISTLEFDIAGTGRISDVEDFLKNNDIVSSPTTNEKTGVTVTPTADPETGFNKYEVKTNVDNNTIGINEDNQLYTGNYSIVKTAETTDDYAAQYKLRFTDVNGNTHDSTETINIPKDYLVKDAYIITYNKNEDGSDYTGTDEIKAPNVYGVLKLNEEKASSYADVTYTDSDTGETVYMECAPADQGLYAKHTYLHLIINTYRDAEAEDPNDDTTDVFIDIDDVINSDAFDAKFNDVYSKIEEVSTNVSNLATRVDSSLNDLQEQINAIDSSISILDSSVSNIESAYIKSISQTYGDGQFNTIGYVDQSGNSSTFEIPNSNYYDAVNTNFSVLGGALTWQNLD